MNEKKLRLIHNVCGAVVSVALIVAAICLIASAYTIYKSGDKPYTPESIKAEYAKIAIPLLVADLAVLAGIILNIALPLPKTKEKSAKDPFVTLRILQKKLPEDCNHDGIARQRTIRKIARTVCALLCTTAFIPSIVILCDFDSFTVANLTPALMRVVYALLGGAAASGVFLVALSVIKEKSAVREIEWTKVALSEGKKDKNKAPAKSGSGTVIARFVLLGVACALIVIGLTQNGFYDVLQKAVRICTECIGLG